MLFTAVLAHKVPVSGIKANDGRLATPLAIAARGLQAVPTSRPSDTEEPM